MHRGLQGNRMARSRAPPRGWHKFEVYSGAHTFSLHARDKSSCSPGRLNDRRAPQTIVRTLCALRTRCWTQVRVPPWHCLLCQCCAAYRLTTCPPWQQLHHMVVPCQAAPTAPGAQLVTGTRRSALRKGGAPIKARVAQLRSLTGVPSPLGNAAAASGAQPKTPASALLAGR